MVHIMHYDPKREYGTSGLLRDGNGNPLVFNTEQEAVDYIATLGLEDAKVVLVDQPIDVHNPGGIPQVGSLGNLATPGKQVHPVSMAFFDVEKVQRVDLRNKGGDASIERAESQDTEGRAHLEGAHTGEVIHTDTKTDADSKKEDEAKVSAKVDEKKEEPAKPPKK